MEKISAVYKIVNEVTGDFYVGSSKDVKSRWAKHKCPSSWKTEPNKQLYKDFQKYGLDKFRFQILAPVESEYLKKVEQEFIEMIHPAYNDKNAKGRNIERKIECNKRYYQSEKCKEYEHSEKRKEAHRKAVRKYEQSEKGKEAHRKAHRKYAQQLCSYNGETLTLDILRKRFKRAGIEHPVIEAKKYLIND